jgi:adenylate cyclase class IV
LGDFLELEVMLADGESVETGEAIARELMGKVGIRPDQRIEGAYVDLLTLKTADAGLS